MTNAVLAGSVVIAMVAGFNYWESKQTPKDKPDVGFVVGHDVKDGILLVTSPTCHYCKESEPFWASLPANVNITVAVPSLAQAKAENYQPLSGRRAVMIEAAPPAFDYRSTPGLAIVREGKVAARWLGKLNSGQEAEVLGDLK